MSSTHNSPSTLSEIPELMQQRSVALRKESYSFRKKRLNMLLEYIHEHRGHIQEAVNQDLNKPAEETDITELYPVITEIKEALKNLRYWSQPDNYASSLTFLGTSAQVQYEPKGVVLIIAPWNYPFNLTVGPLISAIAAGNCVVIKPSEYTPSTSVFIKKMCDDLFDNDMVLVVEGDAKQSQILTSLPFDHIFFTGSPQVGKLVMKAASENLTSVTLELGGKSPTVVDETASINDAAKKIAWGKWINAGQTCVAPDYLFVHESKHEAFLEALRKEAGKLFSQDTHYTSIINAQHFERLSDAMDDGVKQGGKIVFGGDKDEKRNRMYPTVIQGLPESTELLRDEIFGPILPVISYTDIATVIKSINSRPKALALYIFSTSKRNQKRIFQETSSGTAVINDAILQFGHPTLPFGGVNNSGIGKAHGRHGFIAFSNEKSVLKQKVGFTMAQTLYPPYTCFKKWMINILLRYF